MPLDLAFICVGNGQESGRKRPCLIHPFGSHTSSLPLGWSLLNVGMYEGLCCVSKAGYFGGLVHDDNLHDVVSMLSARWLELVWLCLK